MVRDQCRGGAGMSEEFRPCSVDGCDGNSHWKAQGRRGWCSKHYRRWAAHDDPAQGRVANGSLLAFIEGVALSFDGAACLEWPFGKSDNGYGTLRIAGKRWFAHRYTCTRAHGPAPNNADTAHRCGNRACVNPRHLRWASRSQNMEDATAHQTIVGEAARNTKLVAADIPRIRQRLRTESIASIAAAYGVSWGCIYDIRRGKNWRWVR